jgi:transcription elongation GreA/GreB family factor
MFPQLYVRAKVNMWEDESVLYFSSAGLKAKEAEIDELVNVKMRENAKAIGEAASHGDLSENSEYKFALEERDLLRARLAQLNTEISLARVLDPDEVPDDHVSIGQRVTLRPRSGGVPIQMTLLGAGESDIGGRAFSYKTPMAQRVMGKKIGESVTLPVDDREAEFQVERIENALKP